MVIFILKNKKVGSKYIL